MPGPARLARFLWEHGGIDDLPARPSGQRLPHGGGDVVGQEANRAVGEDPIRAPGVLAPEMIDVAAVARSSRLGVLRARGARIAVAVVGVDLPPVGDADA